MLYVRLAALDYRIQYGLQAGGDDPRFQARGGKVLTGVNLAWKDDWGEEETRSMDEFCMGRCQIDLRVLSLFLFLSIQHT